MTPHFSMNGWMIRRANDLQVIQPVIGRNAIDMVNMLVTSKRPSDVLLHDDAVFQSALSVMSDVDVSIQTNVPTTAPVRMIAACLRIRVRAARTRTVQTFAGSDVRPMHRECRATLTADAIDLTPCRHRCHRDMITGTRAIQPTTVCDSGWGSRECRVTLAAGTLYGHRESSSRCQAGGASNTARLLRARRFPHSQANSITSVMLRRLGAYVLAGGK